MAEAAGREEVAATTLKDKSEDSEAAAESSKVVPSQQQQQQKEGGEEEEEEELECAVCLQKCVHPVRLPCSHIFCFLCVKGVANQSKRCAMCRQEIPADFLDHPTLLAAVEGEKEEVLPGGYQWFYEGRNGWWQYDERTSQELEAAYGSGQRACEVLVAGFLYIIDFDRMVQLRRNDPSRRRRIKRDLSSIPKKGVAGIKLPSQLEAELSALHTAAHAIHIPRDQGDSGDIVSPLAGNNNNDLCPRTPTAPSNTPQTPHTPSAASSSSTSPDTTDPTHPHHALAPDPYHHHHYHHHLPHHYHHHHHHHHPPHHHHHHHHQPQHHSSSSSSSASSPHNLNQHHQLHIPHVLANNLSVDNSQPYPQSQSSPNLAPTHPTASEPSVNPDQPQTDLESAVYQMDQLSISADAPEFYPLDLTEDSTEETEQYHLTLSSEEEQL